MATTTVPAPSTTEPDNTAPAARRSRRAYLNSPGLYAGGALGLASTSLTGTPLAATALTSAGIAAAWAALGRKPGPWRWLPGHGDPWQWMCRTSARRYRHALRSMRRRLTNPTPRPQGLVIGVTDGWRHHPARPALVRDATKTSYQAQCRLLRAAWANTLPDWANGWWRPYTAAEMALRAAPLAAAPLTGYLTLPTAGHLSVIAATAAWGAWIWTKPADAQRPTESARRDADWYTARWAQWIATDRGPLPASHLADLHIDDDKLTAIIVSTTARPATGVEQDPVSIAFDVPPRAVNIYRPDDMAASRAKLTVRLRALPTVDTDDLAAVWQAYSPYAGSELHGVEPTEFGRKFHLLMPRRGTGVEDVQPRAIAQALDMKGEDAVSRLHLRVLDARRIEVQEMNTNPLSAGVPLDLDALIMDEQGYISVGTDLYGRPAKWRLLKFDPARRGLSGRSSASAVHAFGSGTTGSGKTSLEEDLQIAQRANGFVSWLADGKGGAGYASWVNDIDWLVKSPFGAMLMAQAGARVSEYRYAEQMKMQWLDAEGYTETGRAFFVPGEPFAPMAITWDEFNEMILKDPQAGHVKPLLRGVSSLGRLSRASGMAARIWVQIPNLDAIGSDASANAIRDMLQSGNIALFRTARADVDTMSLGSRKPQFKLSPLPERFPDGSETGGLHYLANGEAQYTQSRAMFHTNPARVSRQFPLVTVTDPEAEQAGPAYLRRAEYRHLDAADEEAFLRELIEQEGGKAGKNATVVDLKVTAKVDVDDDDLDDLVPPSRSQIVWSAVNEGARRNKHIAEVTDLKPSNVAGATARLERLGKLRKIERDWHTAERLDA